MSTLAKTFHFSPVEVPINDGCNVDFDDIIKYVNDRNDGTSVWEFVKTDRLVITARASNPSTPIAGEIWFNSTDNQFYGYDGALIVILG